MAGDANPIAAAPPNTCICCGVHLTCSNSACSLAAEARAAEGEACRPTPRVPSPRRALRSSDSEPLKSSRRVWDSKPDFPVWVNSHDGHGGRGWEPGIVHQVNDVGDGVYKITVHVLNENGEWGLPSTIKEGNCDPIPSETGDPAYDLSDYIRQRDDSIEGLSEIKSKFVRCLRYYSSGPDNSNSKESEDTGGPDFLGSSLLNANEGEDASLNLHSIVQSLIRNEQVTRVVELATNNAACTPELALAYLVGQFCGIELSESGSDDVKPKELLERLGREDTVDGCAISQVFLISAMSVRTAKFRKMHPANPLFHSRARKDFKDPVKLKARMKRLQTALATIHSSQNVKPSTSGPAFALLEHGIRMMLDMRGTSDPLLNSLAEEGLCRPAGTLRMYIQKLADAIDPLNTRSPAPPGESHVLAWSADNADHHLFQRCVSCVGVGNIKLGTEPKADTDHFNKHFMDGLGRLSDLRAEDLAATSEEDTLAQGVIDINNALHLVSARIELGGKSRSSRSRPAPNPPPDESSTIRFKFRSEVRVGEVQSSTASSATVKFKDGNTVTTKIIPLEDIVEEEGAGNGNEGNGQGQPTGAEPKNVDATTEGVDPRLFDGKRYHFDPTTTTISSVLTGLSSKNNETAKQVINEVKSVYGEEAFNKAVHVLVADQEFMPTVINEFLTKLETGEQLPLLPALAIGHAMKGLSVSMMAFYKCYFDPMLERLGIKAGSPENAKLYKGTVIRKTNSLVTNFTEMLAKEAAYEYLTEVGGDRRIAPEDGSLISPNALIDSYLQSVDPAPIVATAIDEHMRPVPIEWADSLDLLARNFQVWAREKWGTTKRVEVGPSGFERHSESQDAEPQLMDLEQEAVSQSIESHPEYERLLERDYMDNGDTPGLLTLCTNERILGNSSRKDKQTLAKKLFLLYVNKDRDAALKFGPRRKLPSGTNSTGLVIYDLIFGIERCAILLGHRLTKVRDRQDPAKGWLVFFKVLAASTFMRRQPNYQRLTLSFLIVLNLIMKHKDSRCIDLACKRLRWTFAVSEFGDSHRCYPVDLLQEHSIVEQIKKVGRRDPTAYRNLQARSKLQSLNRLRKIEARAKRVAEFVQISPGRLRRAEDEREQARAIAAVWADLLSAMDNADPSSWDGDRILGLGSEESEVLFACKSRAYWRSVDAIDYFSLSASAFIKGYQHGIQVSLPPRPITLLSQLDRTRRKKRPGKQSDLQRLAKRFKLDAEQSIRSDEQVTVMSSSSLLEGITKAGEGKASAYPSVLSTMSKNELYSRRDGQIGDDPSKPVVLTRNKYDRQRIIVNRSRRPQRRNAPIIVNVDVAKDLRRFIPRREGERFKNTVNELARDLLCFMVNEYVHDGVEMLCLTMDVAKFMTSLRVIPHAKRGKMDAITIPHGALAKVKRGTDDLTPHGARSDLLVCGDERFVELLFNTVCNQAKALEREDWKLPGRARTFLLVVIGGSSQACVAAGIGKRSARLNSRSIEVSCQQIESAMEANEIVRQEEGEMMVFGAMAAIIRLGFAHVNGAEGIDCIFVIHSDDSDAFAGISMQSIFFLESTCIDKGLLFDGAIYLHGSSKSAAQVSSLGNIFATNIEIDRELCPTGRGFDFMVDLVSVYYTLEQMDSLPILPRGHRAISAVAVVYTLTNHDYLRMGPYALTYSKLIATLKSEAYKADVRNFGGEKASPVVFRSRAVFFDKKPSADTGYNLPGIILLLHHAFVRRPATNKILKNRYAPEEINSGLGYDVVRAAAVLAGELQQVPDPPALLGHISCANVIFCRWSCNPYDKDRHTDSELNASCYRKSMVKGRSVYSIEYDLCSLADANHRGGWTTDSLMSKLRTAYYGLLFSDAQLMRIAALERIAPLPFHPIAVVEAAVANGGYYPSQKISKELLLPPPAVPGTSPAPAPAPALATPSTDALPPSEVPVGASAIELGEVEDEALDHEVFRAEDDELAEDDESDGEQSVAGSVSEYEEESDEESESEDVDEEL